MGDRRLKDGVYEQLARVGKALSSPKRLELLDLLAQAPRTVEALADETAISLANASQHLRVLRAARLVDSEKRGLYVTYRLASEQVARLVGALRSLAHVQLAEIEHILRRYHESREAMEPVRASDLLERARAGEIVVLDVRPPEEYRAAHFPGAISIPIDELADRLDELRSDREIVAYCRGPYCVMALDAVDLLRRKGFSARRSDEGVVEWISRGVPIETESAS